MIEEMEYLTRKTSIIRFLDSWREYLKTGKLKQAKAFFMGAWSTQDDVWHGELIDNLEVKEVPTILGYLML